MPAPRGGGLLLWRALDGITGPFLPVDHPERVACGCPDRQGLCLRHRLCLCVIRLVGVHPGLSDLCEALRRHGGEAWARPRPDGERRRAECNEPIRRRVLLRIKPLTARKCIGLALAMSGVAIALAARPPQGPTCRSQTHARSNTRLFPKDVHFGQIGERGANPPPQREARVIMRFGYRAVIVVLDGSVFIGSPCRSGATISPAKAREQEQRKNDPWDFGLWWIRVRSRLRSVARGRTKRVMTNVIPFAVRAETIRLSLRSRPAARRRSLRSCKHGRADPGHRREGAAAPL